MTNTERMTRLALQFPTLDKAEGVTPFDPELLDQWLLGPVPCHGALYAGRFILSLWSGRMGHIDSPKRNKNSWKGDWTFPVTTPWRSGPFDLVDAMSTWDHRHREAFLAWARDPWWP